MTDLLARITTTLAAAGPWLGPMLALTAFAEALVVVGVFVPVTPLLIASGAAMGAGLVGPALLPWAMVGGFLGSLASYELGRQLRSRGRGPPRLPGRARLRAEQLFLQHGALAVVLARFLGPPTAAPFLAGWSCLPRDRFLVANAAASMTWPPAMVALGALGAWLAT
jgi:membrane protein DedA with SNARE-associated domain